MKRPALVVLAACVALARPAPAASAAGDLVSHACTYAKLAARCGTFEVPENRSVAGGRTIRLRFVVIPAAKKSAVAVFPVAGGPGQSMVDVGADYVSGGLLDALHPTHDFVFLDQRGTGESHPLNCDLYTHASDIFSEILPLEPIRACRAALAKTSDLNAYGSDAAADDLDALQKRLGYQSIVLYGGSYGTTESLVYLRRHGDSVRNAVLEGVAPPFFVLPLPFLKAAQHALDDLVQACGVDASCNAAFPNFKSEFATLLERSSAGIPVDVVDPATRRVVHVKLMRGVFADRMRQAMYSSQVAAFLPLVVHEAAAGNTAPLGKLVTLVTASIGGTLAMGENISVDCQEFVPFLNDADVQRESEGSFMAGTIVEARRASCGIWKVRPADAAFIEPVRSSVPVLMMSGEDDPATPAQYGTRELAYLPNGRQILIPNGGHDNEDPCLTRIEVTFMETSSSSGLDAGCARSFARPPFATRLPDFLR